MNKLNTSTLSRDVSTFQTKNGLDNAIIKGDSDRRPQTKDFKDYTDFNLAITEWMRARLCDAPNKPGYYRANND